MVKSRHRSIEAERIKPPVKEGWSESNPVKQRQPGWVHNSNDQFREGLRSGEREYPRWSDNHNSKNSGARCDHCVVDDHDLCWRVVCYCPCVRDRFKGDAWPARKTVL
jgi:hypothetical protein